MSQIVKRGFCPNDEKEFYGESILKLQKAGMDLCYLLNQGYPIKGASTFVGNHYLLSERQRLALVRAISPKESILLRAQHEIKENLKGATVHIDGFNTIITLEVAFSGSPLLKCMDGTIRDLAGLRGTYRLIDKTELAIRHIGETLSKHQVKKVIFYLDAPVSNSGRLKEKIIELLKDYDFELEIMVINDVDRVLQTLDHVITTDAIILNQCDSWFNLIKEIMEVTFNNYPYVDLSYKE